MPVKIFQVRGERQRLVFPICQAEQRANPDAPESARVGALRAIQPPVEILLRPRGVERLISFAVVGFLIHDQPFCAVVDEFRVLIVLHRANLKRQGGKKRDQRVEAFL